MDEIKLTLLAPARDLTVAKAAIQAGADAVYIGAPRFGARAQAGNSLEDIATLVNYAHPFGVQVLVTLNTLLTDDERKEAVALAWRLYEIGVDALIIQDLRLLDEDLPPIRLHASTQCDNRTTEQVLHLQELGFKRVVLARELTIDEIRRISQAVSRSNNDSDLIELEAFVHGACCVSYSGRCYMSEVLMNRSANRGCCAQMCRMAYDLLDKDMNEVLDDEGKPIHQRYLLSLQDMDRSLYLRELIEAGVTTFKIEGRLKDADYVTNIVAYYRQLIDNLINSSTINYKTSINSPLSTIIAAIIGSTAVLLLMLALSRKVKSSVSLLIVGLMVGSLASALIGVIQNFADPDSLKLFIVWTLGSLSGVGWGEMQVLLPIMVIGLVLSVLLVKPLNGLILGEDYARSLGINIDRVRRRIVVTTGLLAGGITAFCGPIAFIGVAVPHIARALIGSTNHNWTLPTCALVGANLILLCDLLSSLFVYPLPISTLSALVGAPVIIYVIVKKN